MTQTYKGYTIFIQESARGGFNTNALAITASLQQGLPTVSTAI